MIKKIITILLVVFSTEIIFVACCKCPELPPKYSFTHESLKVDNLNNEGIDPFISNADIHKEAFGIRLVFSLNKIVYNTARPISIFSTANACSCDEENILHPQDTITSITIKTNNNFNLYNKVGADISQYFRYRNHDTQSSPIEVLFTTSYLDNYIQDFEQQQNTRTVDLFLTTPPTEIGTHSFTVEVHFANRQTIVATTLPIMLY